MKEVRLFIVVRGENYVVDDALEGLGLLVKAKS